MDKVPRYGLMELSTKVCGSKERHLVKVYLLILMEIPIMVNGKMIKLMALESTFMQKRVQNTRDIGRMICSMDQA